MSFRTKLVSNAHIVERLLAKPSVGKGRIAGLSMDMSIIEWW